MYKNIHSTISNSKDWKELKCPFMREWMNKLHIHTIENYHKNEWIIATNDTIENRYNMTGKNESLKITRSTLSFL